MGKLRNVYRILVRKPVGKEELSVGGRVILKWILKKQVVKMCSGVNWIRLGTNDGIL
jgi:hypothetical protein